jgi:hypothetical protein
LQKLKEALLTSFEVLAYGALLLVLPCVVADRIFDWMLTEILAQAILVMVAVTAILTTIAVHEGWYLEHLSEWGLARDRVEPSLSPEAGGKPTRSAVDRADSRDHQVGTTIMQPANPAIAQSTPAVR